MVDFYPPQKFTLDDFRKLMDQTRRLGPLNKLMGDAEEELRRFRGIIDSMTAQERRHPTKVIDQSRRRRIAAGAGVEPGDVEQLVRQFQGMADIMDRMDRLARRDPPRGSGP